MVYDYNVNINTVFHDVSPKILTWAFASCSGAASSFMLHKHSSDAKADVE